MESGHVAQGKFDNPNRKTDMNDANRPVVLITGSSGFLGQAIARGLMERYRVIGLDARQPRQPIEGMETVEIDLTSDESVGAAMSHVRESAGNRIASVIHLAAYYDTTGKENPKYDAVTVQGTRRLLEALKKFETEQFVFSSTLLVHAPSPEKGVRINEDSPLDPPWAYPKSKAETETLIAAERGRHQYSDPPACRGLRRGLPRGIHRPADRPHLRAVADSLSVHRATSAADSRTCTRTILSTPSCAPWIGARSFPTRRSF